MGCNHCFVDATPEGENMSQEIFERALDFTASIDRELLLISGGEPMDHPSALDFFKIAKKYQTMGLINQITILSNGLFLEDIPFRDKVFKLNIPIQITNDPRYYPKKNRVPKHPLIMFADKLRVLIPMGRALINNIPASKHMPMCFNLRSLCRCHSLRDAIKFLRIINKMCTPSINTDGSIVGGEIPSCYKIGSIDMAPEDLWKNISIMKCGKCGLQKNIPPEAINLWDEMEGY